ncbi:MAG: HEPN domain-containing protein [Gemmatimonadetes bacterium]|nr:HEPN domain-containing protein [Gemmatimonadota bacterium]
MPHKLPDPTQPAEWLRTARSDLALAQAGRPTADVLYEQLCFHAQQAAEKAVKAVLVARQVDFPKTHVIGELLKLVEREGVTIAGRVWEASDLTPYAVRARYPGSEEDIEEAEHRWAVELAEEVVKWAAGVVARSGEDRDRGPDDEA